MFTLNQKQKQKKNHPQKYVLTKIYLPKVTFNNQFLDNATIYYELPG